MRKDDPETRAFVRAVENGDADTLRAVLAAHPELEAILDRPDFAFDSPAIVHATGLGHRDVVDVLLDAGADPDARSSWDPGPYSALHRCVDGPTPESLELAEHLVSRGATIDLHAAAGLGRLDLVASFLNDHADRVNEPGPDGATPLHLAKDPEMAALLLERGAEIDQRCIDHNSTAAMWALEGREPVTRFLLEQGARPDLYMAAALDDPDLAQQILDEDPEAVRARIRFGESHPHVGGGDKYVWALDFAERPFEVALRRDHEGVCQVLFEASPPGLQLLMCAHNEDPEGLEEMLSVYPDLLAEQTEHELFELLKASTPSARFFVESGVDPDVRNEHGATALHFAAWDGDTEKIELLLDAGATATIRDGTYFATPLGWAQAADRQDIIEMLAARTDVDLLDACWLGDRDRVRALLDLDPRQARGTDDGQFSPLRTAVWHGHLDIVRDLLEQGADPHQRHPESGKNAFEIARERGHEDVETALHG